MDCLGLKIPGYTIIARYYAAGHCLDVRPFPATRCFRDWRKLDASAVHTRDLANARPYIGVQDRYMVKP